MVRDTSAFPRRGLFLETERMQRPSPVTLSSVGFPDCKGEPPHARSTAAASTAAFPHVPKKFNGPEASHTDSGGYKVTVKAYEKENHGTDRHGEFHITHPSGKTKRSGYWMDYPEKGWKHEGVDLRKDYDEHYDRDIEHKSHW